jgi:hypothetical protein
MNQRRKQVLTARDGGAAMYVTTNSALVWKRMADENQQSAKLMARVSAVLAVMVLALGAYVFTSNAKYNDLCTTLEVKAGTADTASARQMGKDIASNFCS